MTKRIKTTGQARRLRHKAELVLAKRRVDAARADWVWAVAHVFAAQFDRWAVGRAQEIQAERAEIGRDE